MDPEDNSTLTFELKPQRDTSVDSNVNIQLLVSSFIKLSVSMERKETLELNIFSPYWIVNKTGFLLQYCVSLHVGELYLVLCSIKFH